MLIDSSHIEAHNEARIAQHKKRLDFLTSEIEGAPQILQRLMDFQVAIPSWALGTGGTRFGRFPGGGEPRSLEEKIKDVGLLHALNRSSGAISLHIPWDIPQDGNAIMELAASHGLKFDAVNSNTFQDQQHQALSYKFGSLQHVDKAVRRQAIEHNIEVIRHGVALGSDSLTVWLSDGSCFPGQLNFRRAFQNTLESLKEIYAALPPHWKMFIEYKAFEPNFYSMTVGDWGQSLLYAQKLGPQAYTLVDLGHHLPNANIEQIVALLLMEGKLGGFHFNDSKYGDDDLTVGSIRPYQLFLIFNELVEGIAKPDPGGIAKPAEGIGKPDAGGIAKPAGGIGKPDAGGIAKPAGGIAKPAEGIAKPDPGGIAKPDAGGIGKPDPGGIGKPDPGGIGKPGAVATASGLAIPPQSSGLTNPFAPGFGWMIDASHNVKDPLEDLLQSVEAIMIAYAQALLVDRKALNAAQMENDTVHCQELLQTAYRTDVRALVAEARLRAGGALEPIGLFRENKVREALVSERGLKTIATGL